MKGISVVVTTVAGEEKNLPACLASIKSFADEIVVVDMSGQGGISKIAKEFGAKVFTHELVNYVEPVRNFGISKATGEWIFILDPDEEVTSSLIDRLTTLVKDNEADYVRVPRNNIVFGRSLKHSRWWPDYNIRFFKEGKVSWNEIIHGVPVTEGRGMDLEAKEEFAIVHHHYDSIEQFVERMNRYTTVQAQLKAKEYKFDWKDLLRRPTAEFLGRFFAAEGYRDGVHGLSLSLLQAFSELVLYLKVWQNEKFAQNDLSVNEIVREVGLVKKELSYWQANLELKENGGIMPRIKRKFKI